MDSYRIAAWNPSDYPSLFFWLAQDEFAFVDDSVLRDIDGFIEQQLYYDSVPSVKTWAAYAVESEWSEWLAGHMRLVTDPVKPWIAEAHCYFSPRARGSGIALEATRRVLGEIFQSSILKIQMCAFADESGERVAKFIEKLGGTLEGRIRMMYSRGGILVDALVYGLTKEEFHQEGTAANMEPHQERVVVEKTELDEKLEKLKVFFSGKIFPSLPEDEQARLKEQAGVMQRYSEILSDRIAAF